MLLRLHVAQYPEHQAIRSSLDLIQPRFGAICISRQIVKEFIAVLTRRGQSDIALDLNQLLTFVQSLEGAYLILDETAKVARRLYQLLETIPVGGKQVHDANIVATILANGITHLYTLNRSDFQRFEGHITLITPDDPAA